MRVHTACLLEMFTIIIIVMTMMMMMMMGRMRGTRIHVRLRLDHRPRNHETCERIIYAVGFYLNTLLVTTHNVTIISYVFPCTCAT